MANSNTNFNSNRNKKLKTKLIIIAIFLIFASSLIVFLVSYSNSDETLTTVPVKSDNNQTTITVTTSNRSSIPEIHYKNILFETDEYIVFKSIKRNQRPFTQGLFMDSDDTLVESGGLYGESTLEKYKVETPDEKIFKYELERQYFAEGACLYDNKIYQLTWKERIV